MKWNTLKLISFIFGECSEPSNLYEKKKKKKESSFYSDFPVLIIPQDNQIVDERNLYLIDLG